MRAVDHPRQRGQALVEMVLVLPVLLLLLLGLICIGQILLANYTVNQAARAAAHQAAIEGGEPEAAYLAAQQVIDAGVGTVYDEAEVAVRCARTPCRRYDAVEVAISYTGDFWAPLPPLFTQFTVSAAATRAAERDQQ
jgi:Flp pilus assembly protein TadG